MASKMRKDSSRDDDDQPASRCGSISGETFASRRSKRAASSVRQRGIDLLADELRKFSLEGQNPIGLASNSQADPSGGPLARAASLNRPRFNRVFHHFRFLIAMFGGFSVSVMFLLRYNITISMLKMVNQTHLYLEEHPGNTVEDMLADGYSPDGEFDWNNEIQQMIMSWYMVAYTLPQIPATKLATIVGSRWSVPAALATCAVSTLLTPAFASLGWQYVIFLRLVNGLGASCILPMLLTLVEDWMRSDEISLGLSFAQGLTAFLAATNPLIAGYLCSIHWSYSFYVPGLATLVFCALWLLLVTDSPIDNYFVSERELKHIYESSPTGADEQPSKNEKDEQQQQQQQADDGLDYKPDSWTQILRVPSFYGYILIWCCYCSSYSGFSFILPTYLRQFLKIKIAQNGRYCFLVQSGCILAVLWPHPLIRLLEQRFKLSISAARRIAHFVCCAMCAATWIYVGAFHEAQLILLFLNRSFHSGNDIVVTGCLMSNYAKAGMSSLVFSIVNTFGNLSVVFSSTFIGWLLDYTVQSRLGWCMIYSGLGAAQLIMSLVFMTVPNGPIKFRNKRAKQDHEAEIQRPDPPGHQKRPDSIATLDNFDKLKNSYQQTSEQIEAANDQKTQHESRQI